MRKPVTLITGAGGEIGHGLVTRLSSSGSPIVTLDVSPLDASLAPLVGARVHRIDHRHEPARSHPRRVRSRPRVPPGGAALHTLGVHAGHRAPGERGRHAQPARVRAEAGRVARAPGRLRLPVVDRGVRAAGSRDEGARRPRQGRRVHASDDDVRVQQAVLRAARPLLRAPLQAALGRRGHAARGFPVRAFPGSHLGDHPALGRDVRLRARDDPRGGEGRTRTSASSGPTPRFRSWRCPTA